MFKKNIREFGRIYDYLKDAKLRLKEIGRQRVTIKDADFSGEKFENAWGYCDFVNCDFSGSYSIHLGQTADCSFTDCNFKGIFGFGGSQNTTFLRCEITGESHLGFHDESTNIVFEKCEFLNSNGDLNHRGSVGDGDITFIEGKARNFYLVATTSLTLRHFTATSSSLGTTSDVPDISANFLLEDCDFRGGVDAEDLYLNSLTLRNCKVGVFKTAGGTVRGDVLIENIKEGHVKISATDIQGKLTVRNCSFYTTVDGHSFRCNTDTPTHSLIENIQCGSAPADVICSGGPMKESDWLPVASNKSTIIRNCKIPHLHVDWMQTEHLRIEDCRFDTLFIRNGRIGKLEIVGCALMKLDVSHTQVKEQNVRVTEGGKISGHITVTKGSNIRLLPE